MIVTVIPYSEDVCYNLLIAFSDKFVTSLCKGLLQQIRPIEARLVSNNDHNNHQKQNNKPDHNVYPFLSEETADLLEHFKYRTFSDINL